MRLGSDFHPLRAFRKRAPIAQMDASIPRCWSAGRRRLPLARNEGEGMPLVCRAPMVLPCPQPTTGERRAPHERNDRQPSIRKGKHERRADPLS